MEERDYLTENLIFIIPDDDAAYELIHNFVYDMDISPYKFYAITPNRKKAIALEKIGVEMIEVAECRDCTNLLLVIRYIFSIMTVLRKIHPDAVLGYSTPLALYGAIAARLCRVRDISAMITKADHLLYFHKWGLRSAHNVIFQDYGHRTLYHQLNLIGRERSTVVNGNSIKKIWDEAMCNKLIDAMNLKI